MVQAGLHVSLTRLNSAGASENLALSWELTRVPCTGTNGVGEATSVLDVGWLRRPWFLGGQTTH